MFIIVLLLAPSVCHSFSTVSNLMSTHKVAIEKLRIDGMSDISTLRHILEFEEEEVKERIADTMEWRNGSGSDIVKRATEAARLANGDGGKWNNDPVLDMAPNYAIIKPFITGKEILTTSTRKGDLIYCVRAGKIDDLGLMASVSVEELEQFFLYAKEVNCLVADERSLASDRLCRVILANDLSGVSLFNSSPDFRKALSQSSTVAASIYPSVNRETLLLNLPKVLSALVKLFKPLFPKSVQKKLKFCQGPLAKVNDLALIARAGEEREKFLDQIDGLIATEWKE